MHTTVNNINFDEVKNHEALTSNNTNESMKLKHIVKL